MNYPELKNLSQEEKNMPLTFTVQPRSVAHMGKTEIEPRQCCACGEENPDESDADENFSLLISISESLDKLNNELNKLDHAIKRQL